MVSVPTPLNMINPGATPVPGGEVLPTSTQGYLYGVSLGLINGLRRLPANVDEIQRDFGADFYGEVARDPQVQAGLRILITGALNRGVQFAIPTPQDDKQFSRAARYAAFVEEAYDRLPRSLENLLYEVGMAALTHGHKLCEKLWTTAKILPNYPPLRIYADIKPKPMQVYRFVQDQFANNLGVVRNVTPMPGGGIIQSGMLGDFTVFPMDWFATLTWDMHNNDLRGNSLLRYVFPSWWDKQQIRPGLLQYLARFGQPALKVVMPPNVPEKVLIDGVEVETRLFYKQVGEDYQAGGVSVWPPGTESDLQEAKGDGQAYINSHKMWSRDISVGLTGQTLATGEGDSRSGTDSRTHQDMLGMFVTFIKGWLGDWVDLQLTFPMIRDNFGQDAVPYAPNADLGKIAPEDTAAILQAFAQLAGPGNYWNPAVVPPDIGAKLDQQAGMPERQTTLVGPDGTDNSRQAQPQAAQPPAQQQPQQAQEQQQNG